ncbi:MAG: phosphatase PAP2 family protein [Chlorobi bacterium]|nr:phosphatase PAP2 family protein [Chlorobiota bacterium]
MNDLIQYIISADVRLFLFLNKFHNAFFDVFMYGVSAKYTWLPLYIYLFVIILKKFKFKSSVIILISIVFLIALSDQSSVHIFKFTFLRFRPCYNPSISDLVHTVKLPGGKYGFISSHASNAFALAFFIHLLFRRRNLSVFMFLWALLTAYSRIYLGVHYPADVFFGALWGMLLAYSVYFVIKNMILEK